MKHLTLDCETSGLPPKGATYEADFMVFPYLVTLAWKVDDKETKHYVINQEGRELSAEVTAIHGITNEIAAASPHKVEDILHELIFDGHGADLCIGHNIFFDTSVIKANVLRLIQEGRVNQLFYDTMVELLHKDRRCDTMHATTKYCNIPGKYGPKWPKLTELHMKLFGETFEAHNSKDDVNATRRCYLKLKELSII